LNGFAAPAPINTMNKTLLCRLAAVLSLAMLGTASPTPAGASTFPALNDPKSPETHAGKFVWAELFTSDAAAATKFYTAVFSWTASTVVEHGDTYTVFSNDGHPVAGLRQRTVAKAGHPARWIHYASVTDIDAALSVVAKAGGEVRAPARKFPKLGSLAIATDSEGSPFGLLQSSSGDSADNEPANGGWNWCHLFVKNPKAAADFYRQVLGYEVAPDSRTGSGSELLLSTGGVNRGGASVLPDSEEAKPGWLGVVRVISLDEALARVPSLGGEVMVPPHDAAFGSRFAVIADPTGGTVGIVQYVDNANPATRP